MAEAMPKAAIVLAAGKSTRMKSELPKVLHPLCGQPLLSYVLDALRDAGVTRFVVVVGFRADDVRSAFADYPGIEFVLQEQQLGTGHAAMVCREALADYRGPLAVMAGDMPLVTGDLVRRMFERFAETGASAFLTTAEVADPTGLGRIVRDAAGNFQRIVEHKDASDTLRAIREINPSFYLFDSQKFFDALAAVTPNNVQGEYYITDAPAILLARGEKVVAEKLATEADTLGVNTRQHLAQAHAVMQERIGERLMAAGVSIVDPRNTYIDPRAQIGRETVIHPFTVISGPVTVGERCEIGPFAHVRPGTVLAEGVRIGAFVEVARSTIGAGATAKHLAYLGDAWIGAEANIGAGAITANYDGQTKHTTRIEANAMVGAGAILVAPVVIGSEATVGAGAVVTKNQDVPPKTTVVGVPAKPKGGG